MSQISSWQRIIHPNLNDTISVLFCECKISKRSVSHINFLQLWPLDSEMWRSHYSLPCRPDSGPPGPAQAVWPSQPPESTHVRGGGSGTPHPVGKRQRWAHWIDKSIFTAVVRSMWIHKPFSRCWIKKLNKHIEQHIDPTDLRQALSNPGRTAVDSEHPHCSIRTNTLNLEHRHPAETHGRPTHTLCILDTGFHILFTIFPVFASPGMQNKKLLASYFVPKLSPIQFRQLVVRSGCTFPPHRHLFSNCRRPTTWRTTTRAATTSSRSTRCWRRTRGRSGWTPWVRRSAGRRSSATRRWERSTPSIPKSTTL